MITVSFSQIRTVSFKHTNSTSAGLVKYNHHCENQSCFSSRANHLLWFCINHWRSGSMCVLAFQVKSIVHSFELFLKMSEYENTISGYIMSLMNWTKLKCYLLPLEMYQSMSLCLVWKSLRDFSFFPASPFTHKWCEQIHKRGITTQRETVMKRHKPVIPG